MGKIPPFVDPEMLREVRRRLLDVTDLRLTDMDANGIERTVLSLNAPGVRGETDELAGTVGHNPDLFSGFAAVALQDPESAAKELRRCVTGFQGRSTYLDEKHSLGANPSPGAA